MTHEERVQELLEWMHDWYGLTRDERERVQEHFAGLLAETAAQALKEAVAAARAEARQAPREAAMYADAVVEAVRALAKKEAP